MKNGARGADRAQIERAQNGQRERLLSVRSRVQIPPSPRQSCPFIYAQVYYDG
jgi:hypothetical protein